MLLNNIVMQFDKKSFRRIKNKVLRKFPNASTQITPGGKYFVSPGVDIDLMDEYMIPPQDNVAAAWFWLSETIRIDQNIERTHPNRMDIGSDEKKFFRISKRNGK